MAWMYSQRIRGFSFAASSQYSLQKATGGYMRLYRSMQETSMSLPPVWMLLS